MTDPRQTADPEICAHWDWCPYCKNGLDTGLQCDQCLADLMPVQEALRELQRLRLAPEPGDQHASGWVIEGAWSPTNQPDYWVGSSAWSADPYKALRFASQQSAQQAADLMCDGLNVRICEHEWACSTLTKDEKHG